MDSFVFEICMYTSNLDKIYIYLEAYLVLMIFMFLRRNFIIELKCLIPWFCWLHNFLHSMFGVYSWFFCFMRLYELYWYVSVDDCVIFMFSWICYCFISYLKDFVLVFKFFHKTNCVFLHLVEFFKLVKLFSNLFLKTPTI